MSDTIEMVALSEADLIRLRFELHPQEVEHVELWTSPVGRAVATTCMPANLPGPWITRRDVTPR